VEIVFSGPPLPASNANLLASRKNQNKQNQLSSPPTSKTSINRQKVDGDSKLVEFWINKQITSFSLSYTLAQSICLHPAI